MEGSSLERLADLVTEYSKEGGSKDRAEKRMDEIKKEVSAIFESAHEHSKIEVAGHSVEMVTRSYERITAQLAKQVLDADTYEKLVQRSSSMYPDIRRKRGAA